jgi:hypothetical protein
MPVPPSSTPSRLWAAKHPVLAGLGAAVIAAPSIQLAHLRLHGWIGGAPVERPLPVGWLLVAATGMFLIVWQVCRPGPVNSWVFAHRDDDQARERNPLFRSPSSFKPATKVLLVAGTALVLAGVVVVAAGNPPEPSAAPPERPPHCNDVRPISGSRGAGNPDDGLAAWLTDQSSSAVEPPASDWRAAGSSTNARHQVVVIYRIVASSPATHVATYTCVVVSTTTDGYQVTGAGG